MACLVPVGASVATGFGEGPLPVSGARPVIGLAAVGPSVTTSVACCFQAQTRSGTYTISTTAGGLAAAGKSVGYLAIASPGYVSSAPPVTEMVAVTRGREIVIVTAVASSCPTTVSEGSRPLVIDLNGTPERAIAIHCGSSGRAVPAAYEVGSSRPDTFTASPSSGKLTAVDAGTARPIKTAIRDCGAAIDVAVKEKGRPISHDPAAGLDAGGGGYGVHPSASPLQRAGRGGHVFLRSPLSGLQRGLSRDFCCAGPARDPCRGCVRAIAFYRSVLSSQFNPTIRVS